MVETISPVVHGGRTRRFWTSLVLHVAGAVIAGVAFGSVLGAIGSLLGAPWGGAAYAALALIALIYVAREAFELPIPVPDRKKQVPEWWRTFFSYEIAALLYGAGLGIGFLTFLTYGTYVAVAAGAFVLGDPLLGGLICGAFALTRSLALVAAPSLDALEAASTTRGPRLLNAGACTIVAVTAMLHAIRLQLG